MPHECGTHLMEIHKDCLDYHHHPGHHHLERLAKRVFAALDHVDIKHGYMILCEFNALLLAARDGIAEKEKLCAKNLAWIMRYNSSQLTGNVTTETYECLKQMIKLTLEVCFEITLT